MNVQSRSQDDALLLCNPQPMHVDIMGVCVVNAGVDVAVRVLDEDIEQGRRIKLAFHNAHGSNLAAWDREYRNCLNRLTVFNDGIGMDLAARALLGRRFRANLNGTDFVPYYLQQTRHQFRIFLLGARPGIAEDAADELQRIAARHKIVGTHHGYIGEAEIPLVLEKIRNSGADLTLVAFGNPLQEKFVDHHFHALNCEMVICVGGLFDFLSGAVPRAPLWLRRLHLEWAFRLLIEPLRMWRRYLLGNFVFMARVFTERLARGVKKVRILASDASLDPRY